MVKNTTDKTLMWKGGRIYPPGADIPDDLAKAYAKELERAVAKQVPKKS